MVNTKNPILYKVLSGYQDAVVLKGEYPLNFCPAKYAIILKIIEFKQLSWLCGSYGDRANLILITINLLRV